MTTVSTMQTATGHSQRGLTVAMAALAFVCVGVSSGCSSTEPKPMAQPSVQDVKGNADRSFERLKQEERSGARPSPSGY